MNEIIGATLIFLGLLLAAAGIIWLVGRGVAVLVRRRTVRQLLQPLMLLTAGLVVGAVPFAYQHAYLAIVGLGERERVIGGERALNLTGWDRDSYEILRERPDVVILEMGNKDVTDDTLAMPGDLPKLKELTLNDIPTSILRQWKNGAGGTS
jgi:F0F1-type ATP synthase membrane subunit c/vacuolar-type H+-ATPase subunit K